MVRREPVDRLFLENLDRKLEALEEMRAPPILWRMLDAVAKVAEEEARWVQELQEQEFRE